MGRTHYTQEINTHCDCSRDEQILSQTTHFWRRQIWAKNPICFQMPETCRQCSKRAVMPKTSFGGSCTWVGVENSQWKIWCRVGPERLLLMCGLLLELNGWGGAGSGEVDRAVGWALCRHKTVNTSHNCTTVKASTKLWTGHVSQLLRTTRPLLHLSTMISPQGRGATFFANNIELGFWTSSCALV